MRGWDSSYETAAVAEICLLGTITISCLCRLWGEVYACRRVLHRGCAYGNIAQWDPQESQVLLEVQPRFASICICWQPALRPWHSVDGPIKDQGQAEVCNIMKGRQAVNREWLFTVSCNPSARDSRLEAIKQCTFWQHTKSLNNLFLAVVEIRSISGLWRGLDRSVGV